VQRPCSPNDFCGKNDVKMSYNWDDEETIDNLILQFSMECEDPLLLGLIGSCFLAGIVLGSVSLTRIGDVYGRRPGFAIGLLIQSAATLCVLMTRNYHVACLLCFIIGFAVTGKQYVGWNYLLEMQPKDMQIKVGTTEFICEAAVYIMVTFYFWFVSKHWQYI
jgi:MFS family permease